MSHIEQTHILDLTDQIAKVSHRLANAADLDALLEEIGDARYVLLGEASHGTHEYYTWRTHISKRLISEKNFSMIAVEGDWPDCYRLNRYIKGYPGSGESAKDVFHAFNRWPTWMWANWETVALAEWLRKHNSKLPLGGKVGFYGLDVYSLWESMEAITKYLEKTDPAALKSVQEAMDCFEPFDVREGFSYAARSYGLTASCEQEVENLLANIRRKMPQYNTDHEEVFSAEQNALVAVNAERYYHVMMGGGEASWNIRDRHMSETINRLMEFHGKRAKIIIWEHNTHIGDARATDMKHVGLINVGQLVKEEHASEGVVRIGFGSFEGTVLAAYHWGSEVKKMKVPKAVEGSWEHLLQNSGAYDKYILSKDIKNFKTTIGHRAIGVVYDPDYEYGNYVASIIPSRYEAFMFFEKTQALHSLHVKPDGLQMPETYPWGV
ncbi:MAG: erythromycin esterase family protein [Bacteroidetes bacterium]|nr:erythromycin esterase family protein [Bacteroidota bacterium]